MSKRSSKLPRINRTAHGAWTSPGLFKNTQPLLADFRQAESFPRHRVVREFPEPLRLIKTSPYRGRDRNAGGLGQHPTIPTIFDDVATEFRRDDRQFPGLGFE